ncbi:MAG: hypothetical protein ACREUG_02085 [Steroidobacteraceae bacterium]
MRLRDQNGGELLRIESVERDGNRLLIRGKVFGAMPLAARLDPSEARSGLKLLTPRLVWFLLTLPFRRSGHL